MAGVDGGDGGSLADGRSGDLAWRAGQVREPGELAGLLRVLRRRHARDHRDKELTSRELAGLTGWSHTAIAEYLTGRTLPSTDRFDALVQVFGATPAEQRALATARDRVEERRRSGRIPGESSPGSADERFGSARHGSSRSAGSSNGSAGWFVPRQLPAAPAQFVGRTAELSTLFALLDQPPAAGAVVISVLAGTAGVGKTALAVHWAHRVADRFGDGQLYVNLRGFDPAGSVMSPAEALRGFLDALQIPPQRIPAGVDSQVALYRSALAERRMLIVLDNARDAEQVRPLLPGTPGCLVVVTSRSRLTGLVVTEGASSIALDLLSTGEASDLIARRIGPERVAAEPRAVEEIIALCARLPLALSIVAARAAACPGLALAILAEELRQNRLDALDTRDAATDVRRVFSWSYHSLAPASARLFRLLGVNPGPDVSARAAANLGGLSLSQALPLLAELVDANLLIDHARGRYAFHDLLRAYAAERTLASDTDEQRDAATQRLLDHYLHTANAADRLLDPYRDPITLAPVASGATPEHLADSEQSMRWFVAEHAVLLAAVNHAASTGRHTHVWELAWTLTTFLNRRGHWREQLTVQQAAVTAAGQLADLTGQSHGHRNLAIAYLELGRHDEALVHLQHALDAATRADDTAGQARTHISLGYFRAQQNQLDEALAHARRALNLYRTIDDQAGQARALNQIGWFHGLLGDYEQAVAHCQRALALHQTLEYRSGQAAAWDSLGYAYHHLGRLEQAIDCYRQALELTRILENRPFSAEILDRLGDTYHAAGDRGAALAVWRSALEIFDELDQPDAMQVRAKLNDIDR